MILITIIVYYFFSFLQSGSEVALWNMESLLNELWATYLQETEGDIESVKEVDKPKPKELVKSKSSCAEEQLVNMCEKLHIEHSKDDLASGGEGWHTVLGGKETDGETNIESLETNTVPVKENEASALNCDTNDCEAASNPPDSQLTQLPTTTLDSSTTNQSEQDNNDSNSVKHVNSKAPRKKSSVEGGRPYIDYLQLDGVEIILLSPSRLNDLSSLSEVSQMSGLYVTLSIFFSITTTTGR